MWNVFKCWIGIKIGRYNLNSRNFITGLNSELNMGQLFTQEAQLPHRWRTMRNGHSWSLKVISCASRCSIYDFLLALNSNSLFNRSWDIMPSLHIHSPCPTSLPGGTGKRQLGVGRHALVSDCPARWTIPPYIKSTLKCIIWLHCTPVPDGQMDKHPGNSSTIRSNNM